MNTLRFAVQASKRLGKVSTFLQEEVFVGTDPEVTKHFWNDVVLDVSTESLETVLRRLEQERISMAFKETLEPERIHTTEQPIDKDIYTRRVEHVRRTVEVLGMTENSEVALSFFEARRKLFSSRRQYSFDDVLYHYFPHEQSIQRVHDLRELVQKDLLLSNKSRLRRFTQEKYFAKPPLRKKKEQRGFKNYATLLDIVLDFHPNNKEHFISVCDALDGISHTMEEYYVSFPESEISCEAVASLIREKHISYFGRNFPVALKQFTDLSLGLVHKQMEAGSLANVELALDTIFSKDPVRNKDILFLGAHTKSYSKESLVDIVTEQSTLLRARKIEEIRGVHRELNKANGVGLPWRAVAQEVLRQSDLGTYGQFSDLTQFFNRFTGVDERYRKELFQALYTGSLRADSKLIIKRLEEQRKKGIYRTLRTQLGLENWLTLLQREEHAESIAFTGEDFFLTYVGYIPSAQTISVPIKYAQSITLTQLVERVSHKYVSDPVWKRVLEKTLEEEAKLVPPGSKEKTFGSILGIAGYTLAVEDFEKVYSLGKTLHGNSRSDFYNLSFMYLHHCGAKDGLVDVQRLSSLHSPSVASFLENKYYRFFKESTSRDFLTGDIKRSYEEHKGFTDFPAVVQSFCAFKPENVEAMEVAASALRTIYDITRRVNCSSESISITCERFAHILCEGREEWL